MVETCDTLSRDRDGEVADSARLLLIVSVGGDTRIVELRGEPVTVGRGDSAEVRLAEPSLSRAHARFHRAGDAVKVEDLGSRNGTRVNGIRVDQAELRAGDVAVLGDVVVCVQLVEPARTALLGLASIQALRGRIEHECRRAQTFGRPLSVVFLRAEEPIGEGSFVAPWAPLLRASDVAGIYDTHSLVVLLPETDGAAAEVLAAKLAAATSPRASVVGGVASFPESAFTPDHLLSSAIAAAGRTTSTTRIAVAPAELPRHMVTHDSPAPSAPPSTEPLPDLGIDLRDELQRHEAGLIMRALQKTNGHQRRAAALLKLPLRTFERKLKDLGLNRAGMS